MRTTSLGSTSGEIILFTIDGYQILFSFCNSNGGIILEILLGIIFIIGYLLKERYDEKQADKYANNVVCRYDGRK